MRASVARGHDIARIRYMTSPLPEIDKHFEQLLAAFRMICECSVREPN